MNDKHPTYPNPTIQEALCEIHFRLPGASCWQPSLLGEFFRHVQSEFPVVEPAAQIGYRVQMGPDAVEQTFVSGPRWRYRHASRRLLLQLSDGVFTVNELPKYPGWKQMSEDIVQAWTRARQVIGPEAITRIGLRYINRIERTLPDEPPGQWLAPSEYVPGSILYSMPGFLYRSQSLPDRDRRRIVTLGETADAKAIVFDIDCIAEKQVGIQDEDVLAELAQLHDAAWSIFSASKTPRLQSLLEGGGS